MKDKTFLRIAGAIGTAALFAGSFAPIPAHAATIDCDSGYTAHVVRDGVRYTLHDCWDCGGAYAYVDGAMKKSIKRVTIPRYVKSHGHKCKVNQIGKRAFAGCKKIKAVTIRAHISWQNFGQGCFAFGHDRPIKWRVCKYTTKQLDKWM